MSQKTLAEVVWPLLTYCYLAGNSHTSAQISGKEDRPILSVAIVSKDLWVCFKL